MQTEIEISIHALREESDQPTRFQAYGQQISIHALREESDWLINDPVAYDKVFQSTLSVRRATQFAGQSD
ncbi:Conserved hypothetical protein [Bifidobacterium dentium Bd1]|uniref:Uncharacterized protein n=1 Tax=Bifidobacterium dentium (strain ATCC 27534 / DSM 20436 / JCM 1195 / Bd1) TaxID=401473 RepID=D2Q5L6_BIFDB|nr:Conserved hypothetical protein [Bifidobacterium dentium Bd1]